MPPAPPPHNDQKGKIISVGIPVSIVPFSSHSRPDQATPDQTKSRERLQQLISGGSSNAEFDRLVKERIKVQRILKGFNMYSFASHDITFFAHV